MLSPTKKKKRTPYPVQLSPAKRRGRAEKGQENRTVQRPRNDGGQKDDLGDGLRGELGADGDLERRGRYTRKTLGMRAPQPHQLSGGSIRVT